MAGNLPWDGKPPRTDGPWLSAREAATRPGVSRQRVTFVASQGRMPAIELEGRWWLLGQDWTTR